MSSVTGVEDVVSKRKPSFVVVLGRVDLREMRTI